MAFKPYQRSLSLTPKELFIQSIHKIRDLLPLTKSDEEYIRMVGHLERALKTLYTGVIPPERKHATNYGTFLELLGTDKGTYVYANRIAEELEMIMFEAGLFGGNEQTAVMELEEEEKDGEDEEIKP
jgi:hypothetical protein